MRVMDHGQMSAIAEGRKSISKLQKYPADEVHVVAPARLHMGFLDLNGGLGRLFGSIGLGLENPATELTLQRAAHDTVTGVEQDRGARALRHFKTALGIAGNFRL